MKMDGQMETAHSFRPQRPEDTGCRAPTHTWIQELLKSPPLHGEGALQLGLNSGSPDGAHGVDTSMCPPKPCHCGGQRTWTSSAPAQTGCTLRGTAALAYVLAPALT